MIGLKSIRLLLGAALAFFSSGPAGAEEGTVEAYSSWQARGEILETGAREMTFVGSLSGVLFVKATDGSTDSGKIMCPGTVVVDTQDFSMSGSAKCVILTPDDERIYAEFTCSGVYGSGCNGVFTLKGGTGDKENISGGGPIQLMSEFADLTVVPGSIVEHGTVGLAVWPKLTYKTP